MNNGQNLLAHWFQNVCNLQLDKVSIQRVFIFTLFFTFMFYVYILWLYDPLNGWVKGLCVYVMLI